MTDSGMLATAYGSDPVTDVLGALMFLGVSLAVVLGLSHWLLTRFGVRWLALMTLVSWPIGTVWYALTLRSMDRHFVNRWQFGTWEAGKILTCVFLAILGAGMLTSARWWSKVFAAWKRFRTGKLEGLVTAILGWAASAAVVMLLSLGIAYVWFVLWGPRPR